MLITLSLMIIVGFLSSELFHRIKLPRIVGMLLAGILIGPFVFNLIAPEVLLIASDIRKIALIIILLRAGLSLDLKDLKKVGKQAIFLSLIPATLEMIGAMILGPVLLGLTILESAILGAIIAAVSPAVIVPKMLKMIEEKHGTQRSIPQMILASASVDDVYVIIVFTSLVSLAQSNNFQWTTVLDLPLAIIFGIAVGITLGLAFVWYFKNFHIRDTAKVLMILSFSLFLVALESFITLPFSGLLAVMTLGITILMQYAVLAERLVKKYEKIWVFSEMLLFILVGAAVDITALNSVGLSALVLVFILLLWRSIGVLLATIRSPLTWKERLFTVFAFMPKATVQASIGAIPLSLGIANGQVMLTVAVLSILITAPLGSFLMDYTKDKLVQKLAKEK